MMFGKVITLYLIDADPTGRIAAELLNWTGKLYKIPRTLLKESASRVELEQAGVYLLVGRNELEPDKPHVYVGEAEEVYRRLKQHADKDFWNEVIVCISKDENLNKAHIKFLENEMYTLLHEIGRAHVHNSVVPTRSRLAEHERAFLHEFFGNLKLLVSSLGYRFFDPQRSASEAPKAYFYIQSARGANATALRSNEGMVVLKGSQVADTVVSSASAWVLSTRQKLLETGVLDESWTFLQDYTFASPSTAAAVVMGRNANGLTEWKDAQRQPLKQIEAA